MTKTQRDFISAFAQYGSVLDAARSVSPRGDKQATEAARRAHYRALQNDPAYAAAFAEVRPLANGKLEDAAVGRAVKGWLEPVYQGGQLVGHVRKYDSGLLKFLLRGNMPDKYGDKITQSHEGAVGLDVVVTYERAPTDRG